MATLVTVHGMLNDPSAKNWQDEVSDILRISGHSHLNHLAFKYPYIGIPTKAPTIPFLPQLAQWYEERKRKTWAIGRTVSAQAPANAKSLWLTNAILEETTSRFKKTLLELLQDPDAWPVGIVAHSLGCAVVIKAIEGMNVPRPSPLHLRLMAAPFAVDYQLMPLSSRLANCVIEYSTQDDLWLDIQQAKLLADTVKPLWAGFAALQGFSQEAYRNCDNVKQEECQGFLHGDFVEPLRLLDTWLPSLGFKDKWHPYQAETLQEFYARTLAPLTRDLVDTYFRGYDISAEELRFLYEAAEELVLTGSCSDRAAAKEGSFRRVTPNGVQAAVAALVSSYYRKTYATLQ